MPSLLIHPWSHGPIRFVVDDVSVVDDVGVIIKSSELGVKVTLVVTETDVVIVTGTVDVDVTVADGTRPTTQKNSQSHQGIINRQL